ncbi:MAG: response regulator transcription factor, partial [bacterium]
MRQLSVASDQLSVSKQSPVIKLPESSIEYPASSIQEPATNNERDLILIVEDNTDMRAYIRDQLTAGYRVLEAVDGREGLDKALETIPDLIISDVMMPKLDGYQLCEKLKTDERTSHVPVILLTAKSSGESKIEGLELGADDYVTKPFDSRELHVRVKNLITLRRKLRERFTRALVLKPSETNAPSMDEAFLRKVMAAV